MKPEALFLLAGGAALLLYFLDNQQTAAPVAAPPSPDPSPQAAVQPPASPAVLPALPLQQTYQSSPEVIFDPGATGRTIQRYVGDPLLKPVTPLAVRNPGRVSTTQFGISGLSLYGGWGK
jgi:hypothetical protein